MSAAWKFNKYPDDFAYSDYATNVPTTAIHTIWNNAQTDVEVHTGRADSCTLPACQPVPFALEEGLLDDAA